MEACEPDPRRAGFFRFRRMRRTTFPSPKDIAPTIIAHPFQRRSSGARVLATERPKPIWRAGTGCFHRRAAASAEAAKPSRRHGLARETAAQHPRQHLAAGHRLRKARSGDRRLSAARACPRFRRQPGKLLVIYCQANCWMSWNAAKRALSYGYPNVAWYPEGTDGWQRADLPWRNRSRSRARVRRIFAAQRRLTSRV